jgi:hypothetical protein
VKKKKSRESQEKEDLKAAEESQIGMSNSKVPTGQARLTQPAPAEGAIASMVGAWSAASSSAQHPKRHQTRRAGKAVYNRHARMCMWSYLRSKITLSTSRQSPQPGRSSKRRRGPGGAPVVSLQWNRYSVAAQATVSVYQAGHHNKQDGGEGHDAHLHAAAPEREKPHHREHAPLYVPC